MFDCVIFLFFIFCTFSSKKYGCLIVAYFNASNTLQLNYRQSDMVSNSSCGLQDDMFDMTKRAVDNKIRVFANNRNSMETNNINLLCLFLPIKAKKIFIRSDYSYALQFECPVIICRIGFSRRQ